MEVPELLGSDVRVPWGGISAVAETLIVLRYVELRSKLFRLISLFKVREGAFDPTIRQFVITDSGIVVGEPFEGVEAILSGMPREAVWNAASVSLESGGDPASSEATGQTG
jgi:circadian clock protein KaiC